MLAAFTNHASFARREVMAPAGLWERGPGASGYIPPSGRLFPLSDLAPLPAVDPRSPHRAPKALAISPSGETGASPSRGVGGDTPILSANAANAPTFKASALVRSTQVGRLFDFRQEDGHTKLNAVVGGFGVGLFDASAHFRDGYDLDPGSAFFGSLFFGCDGNVEINRDAGLSRGMDSRPQKLGRRLANTSVLRLVETPSGIPNLRHRFKDEIFKADHRLILPCTFDLRGAV